VLISSAEQGFVVISGVSPQQLALFISDRAAKWKQRGSFVHWLNETPTPDFSKQERQSGDGAERKTAAAISPGPGLRWFLSFCGMCVI
jgi:hypothetical protein